MQNKQLRNQIEGVWSSIKGLKAIEIEQQIEISKQIVQALIGVNEIQKIRNSSLLKLLVYQLIIFSDEKSKSQDVPTARMLNQFSRTSQKIACPLNSIKQLKKIFTIINSRIKLSSTEAKLSLLQLKDIVKRINGIEEELIKEQQNRRKSVITNEDDEDGMELMVEQLENLLKKKQNRIKELNDQLQQNFQDKHQLETEIADLQQQNKELTQSVRLLMEQSQKLKEELERVKGKQKDEFLIGASDFMNISFPHKPLESTRQINISVAGNEENQAIEAFQMSQSTKCLSKYFDHAQETQQTLNILPKKQQNKDQKTIKKAQSKTIKHQLNDLQEENLLQSMRIFKNSPSQDIKIDNQDHFFERMLLIQASFIEKAMETILN